MSESAEENTPLLQVVRGRPSEEELAAVLVVLRARTGAGEPSPTAPVSGWGAPSRAVRLPLRPGPGAWQAATRW